MVTTLAEDSPVPKEAKTTEQPMARLETENGFIHSTPVTHTSTIHLLPGASLVFT